MFKFKSQVIIVFLFILFELGSVLNESIVEALLKHSEACIGIENFQNQELKYILSTTLMKLHLNFPIEEYFLIIYNYKCGCLIINQLFLQRKQALYFYGSSFLCFLVILIFIILLFAILIIEVHNFSILDNLNFKKYILKIFYIFLIFLIILQINFFVIFFFNYFNPFLLHLLKKILIYNFVSIIFTRYLIFIYIEKKV